MPIATILRLLLIITLCWGSQAWAAPIPIVAAENFYGAIAAQLGGPYVQVTSLMSNPNQDPHLFSAAPSQARVITDATIVVYNGIAYDPWMEKLLAVAQHEHPKTVLVVAQLADKKLGDNPHIWYDPNIIARYAQALTQALIQQDPNHRAYYEKNLQQFNTQLQVLLQHMAQIKQHFQGTSIIATEPVFNAMADALGLVVHGQDFQLSVMNDIAPSPSQIKNFENDLRTHAVRVLIFNNQVVDPVTDRMQKLAVQMNIPVVGVSETQPADKDYVTWMDEQLTSLEKGLHP